MNKTFNSFLLLLSSTFLLASCNGGNDNSSSVVTEASLTLNQSALSLEAYETSTLTYTLTGKEGTPSWTSSDASVATVDSDGKVTGVKAGNCTITAALGELSATCEVTVTAISQAPRIVLGEPSVSLDKDNTYTIDAYAIYKNEARDDVLEISLKSGADDSIASVSYSNKKITVNGLKYGSTDYVVHANVLGVLVTASLHVTVVNADVSLKLGNVDLKDGDYSLNLGLYRVDEDDLPTEFAPEIIFTDKEQPATYDLAYTTSDATIATWDENHKILAKGIGETTVKIACEQFGLSLEINVSVVKGAYDVTLKNINASGESTTEKVGTNKMPKYVPNIEGKSFAGWYDEDGNKVTSVAEDMTLTARYTVSYYTEGNEKLLKFTNNQSDYTTPEGVDAAFATRATGDIETDINQWHLYPGTPEGSQGFYPGENDTISLGLGLPAFDFSKVSGVRFVFGFRTGVWASADLKGVYLNGTSIGVDANGHAYENFVVNISGKTATVFNQDTATTYEIALSDDVYTGKKGLEITVDRNWGAWLFITPYTSMDCDYVSLMNSVEESLPEEPASGYSDKLEAYSLYRSFMTEYEKTAYPISKKMQAWLDAAKATKVLAFDDHGDSVYSSLTGNSSFTASSYVNSYANNGYRDESRTDSLQFQLLGLDYTYFTLTLPKFDFSSYAKVSFTMEVGGGPGDKTFDYWLGAIPDTAATTIAKPTDVIGGA